MLHYVLGYADNPIIVEYKEKFFDKLLGLLQQQVDADVYEKFLDLSLDNQKHFLFLSDVSSNLIFQEKAPGKGVNMDLVLEELSNYIEGKKERVFEDGLKKIPHTQIFLTPQDYNPFCTTTSHPSYTEEVCVSWGERPEQEWLQVYGDAFDLLKKIDVEFFSELNHIVQKVVPFGTSRKVHHSCSFGGCIGNLYMGYTIDSEHPELNVIEAIIHESSHNKLNLVMMFDQLIMNDNRECYYSPYRPDARHMHGVFLGIHALVPTMYILLKGIRDGFITDIIWREKILLYHIKNKLGVRTVENFGELSDLGKIIFQQIKDVVSLCDTLVKEIDFHDIDRGLVLSHARGHFQEVNMNYPQLKY